MIFYIKRRKKDEYMRILIVEDELHLNDLLNDYILDKFDFAEIDQVLDGYDAVVKIKENTSELGPDDRKTRFICDGYCGRRSLQRGQYPSFLVSLDR